MQYHNDKFRGNPNYNAEKIKYHLAQLGVVIGDRTKEDLKVHEHEMLRLSKPVSYNIYTEGNAEIQMVNGFNRLVFTIEQHTTQNVLDMPTTKVYDLFDWIEENNKPKKDK